MQAASTYNIVFRDGLVLIFSRVQQGPPEGTSVVQLWCVAALIRDDSL